MTEARKVLLLVLVPLLALPIAVSALGQIGSVELLLWIVLLIAWVVAFTVAGRRREDSHVGTP